MWDFYLKIREWKSINVLPKAYYRITAAIIGNNIILSGYHLNCYYSYNDSTFSSILNLQEKVNKIVCEGWIYTNSMLYEDQIASKWSSYTANPWDQSLLAYCIFKRINSFNSSIAPIA